MVAVISVPQLVAEYVIIAVPVDTPVTVPEASIVATVVGLIVQVPPPGDAL
jgi:hypothetical protein